MRKFWLIFAQAVTVSLAVFWVVFTVFPEWRAKLKPPAAVQHKPNALSGSALSYRDAARKALPSIVHILTTQKSGEIEQSLADDAIFRHFFGPKKPAEEDSKAQAKPELGSGVIVSVDGYILTNFHVIDGAEQIEVILQDGQKLPAQLVGSDAETDLAVLRVDAAKTQQDKLPAIEFGKMEDIAVGDVVLAIGNPFGVGQTVTQGIVSALGRSHLGINTFENFIQTDAAINPGNSGGALIDSRGHFIGVNTAIYSSSGGSLGIGFAIPVSTAQNVMGEIIQTGEVTRGWIGVEMQEITPELAESFGLGKGNGNASGTLIAGVQRGSPADQGQIKPGDILLSVGNEPIKDPQSMLSLIAAHKPGEMVAFKLQRKGKLTEVSLRIGKRPAPTHE